MPDPFDQLRDLLAEDRRGGHFDGDHTPNPEFAARLRERLAHAFDLPKGVTVSDLNIGATNPQDTPTEGPRFRHGDIGYASLWVPDVGRAASFYATVLGWRYRPGSGSEGRQVEGLALHHGLWGGVAPPTLFCCFAVDDIATATARVNAAGGTAGNPEPQPYGLISECTDDQSVRFALFEPPGGVAPDGSPGPADARNGDLAYVTFEVVDSSRTRAFYGAVLGWQSVAGRVEDGWQVQGVAPLVGISGGHPTATTVPMYRVDDVNAAVAAVRGAGGTATGPEQQPYGLTATCADDQGTRFYLGQFPS